jgi:ABC-type uncharacterized transport system permease subunit
MAGIAACLAGIVGLIYFIQFFIQNSQNSIDVTQLMGAGFLVGLIACIGLILQIFIPRPAPSVAPYSAQSYRIILRLVINGLLITILGFFLAWMAVRSNLHVGLIIMVLIVWLTDWFLTRTTVGFELRTVGANADAARYAGMNVKWNIILAMTLSGALAGLAGAVEIAGVKYTMQPDFFANLGFDAIAVALLARTEPRSMIWAGFLWGGLLAGANLMQVRANISIDLVLIIQALIIMFIAADQIIRYLWRVPEATLEEKQAATLARGWSG